MIMAEEEKPKEEEKKPAQKAGGGEKKGKKVRTGRKHESSKVHTYFDGKEGKRLKTHCPRCGPGTWLSVHKNRLYCGRCGYTEFKKKEE